MQEVLTFTPIILIIIIIIAVFYKYYKEREIGNLITTVAFILLLVYTIFEISKSFFVKKYIKFPFFLYGLEILALIFVAYAMFYERYGGKYRGYFLGTVLTIGIIANFLVVWFIAEEYTKSDYTYETYWGTKLLRIIQFSFLIFFSFLSFRLWIKYERRNIAFIGTAFLLWAVAIILLILDMQISKKLSQFFIIISFFLLGYIATTKKEFLLNIVPTIQLFEKYEEEIPILKSRGFHKITNISLFKQLLEQGAEGLILTRYEPSYISGEYGIRKIPIIWLTSKTETKELWCHPAKIFTLKRAISEFIEKSKNPIILIDLEYLVKNNRTEQKNILDFVLFLIQESTRVGIFIESNNIGKVESLDDLETLNPLLIEQILNTVIPIDEQKVEVESIRKKEKLIKYDNGIVVDKAILSKEEFERIIKTILSHFEDERIRNRIITLLKKYHIKTSIFILKKGESYLTTIDNGFKLFAEYKYAKKLCLTRTSPKNINRKYSIIANFKWLSRVDSEDNIPPTDLARILNVIKEFASENEDYIILINGFDYLVFQNGFENAIKIIALINEFNTIKKGVVIYLIDERLIDDYSSLIREMNILK